MYLSTNVEFQYSPLLRKLNLISYKFVELLQTHPKMSSSEDSHEICIGIKANGERCQYKSKNTSKYCRQHDPVRKARAIKKKKKIKQKKEKKVKLCVGLKKDGRSCNFKALQGEEMCKIHLDKKHKLDELILLEQEEMKEYQCIHIKKNGRRCSYEKEFGEDYCERHLETLSRKESRRERNEQRKHKRKVKKRRRKKSYKKLEKTAEYWCKKAIELYISHKQNTLDIDTDMEDALKYYNESISPFQGAKPEESGESDK